jgi:hypothetical protein
MFDLPDCYNVYSERLILTTTARTTFEDASPIREINPVYHENNRALDPGGRHWPNNLPK